MPPKVAWGKGQSKGFRGDSFGVSRVEVLVPKRVKVSRKTYPPINLTWLAGNRLNFKSEIHLQMVVFPLSC